MDITTYIISECEHQKATTPADFIGMARAYNAALNIWNVFHNIEVEDILVLGFLVDGVNRGFRTGPVVFDNGTSGAPASEVYRLVYQLVEANPAPDDWYQEFERIHPFFDGNGRVGSLCWNVLTDNMDSPVHPPRFKAL